MRYALFVSILQIFRNQKQEQVVPRSPLTIAQGLEAARQAGLRTPDTGLFDGWLRAKGLSSRGAVLIARMRRDYESAFEERFGQIAFLQRALPSERCGNPRGSLALHGNGNCPTCLKGGDHTTVEESKVNHGGDVTFPPISDPRRLNLEFLERVKAGDAKCARNAEAWVTTSKDARAARIRTSNEGAYSAPSFNPASIESLYASGQASSLREALAILGGVR